MLATLKKCRSGPGVCPLAIIGVQRPLHRRSLRSLPALETRFARFSDVLPTTPRGSPDLTALSTARWLRLLTGRAKGV
jgi:hypothetical protein